MRTFCGVGTLLLAAETSWPVLVLAVAVAVALCLWGLFRRGSIGHRARTGAAPSERVNGQDDDGH